MVSSLIFGSVTNIINLVNAIESSSSEKHFKPIYDMGGGIKIILFSCTTGVYLRGHLKGGLFE